MESWRKATDFVLQRRLTFLNKATLTFHWDKIVSYIGLVTILPCGSHHATHMSYFLYRICLHSSCNYFFKSFFVPLGGNQTKRRFRVCFWNAEWPKPVHLLASALKQPQRCLHLYYTFEGIPKPSPGRDGKDVHERYRVIQARGSKSVWRGKATAIRNTTATWNT